MLRVRAIDPTCCVCQIGAKWLREWCGRASGGVSAAAASDDVLPLAVARILLNTSPKPSDETAAELFDLLGDGAFENIQVCCLLYTT